MSNEDPIAGDQLKSIVERIERLESEKNDINSDISDVYKEAKGNGYDVKVLRKVVALRRRDIDERREEEAILDLYLQAVGENRDTPAPSAASNRIKAKGMDTAEDLYKAAVRLVQTDGKASASYVQRRMGLGYNRAAGFMERMEKEGIVSAADDAGQRRVLTPMEGMRQREKDRLSGSMADNKLLSQQMLDDGLITAEQHAENVALSDAVATKLGSGVAKAAKQFAETMNKAGATVEVRAAKGSIFEKAGEAAKAAGANVTITERKPLVGSFTPPREDPFGGDE